jgi:hypothetical protein
MIRCYNHEKKTVFTFAEAMVTAEKAHNMALIQGPGAFAREVAQRLKLYQEKRPYRQALSGKRIG